MCVIVRHQYLCVLPPSLLRVPLLLHPCSHAAASYGNLALLQWLLTNGASPSLLDEDGDSPLHACEDPSCADALLGAGADPFLFNAEGFPPYVVAVQDDRKDMCAWFAAQYTARGLEIPVVIREEDDEGEGGEEDDDMEEGEAASTAANSASNSSSSSASSSS